MKNFTRALGLLIKKNIASNVLRLCVCLPLVQRFNLTTNLMGQIAQNRCYTLARLIKNET